MITINQLMQAADYALCKHFTVVQNGVKTMPNVCDETKEMFLNGEEGVAVWCGIPDDVLTFFEGNVRVIISAEEGTVCANVFFGDCCINEEQAEALAEDVHLGSWEVEDLGESLGIATAFPDTANVAEELSKRFGEFLDEGFGREIGALLSYFA